MRGARLIVGVIPATLLSACAADYPHIATLSGTAVKTVASWQPFVDDYPRSCRRAWALGAPLGAARPGTDPCASFVARQAGLAAALAVLTNYFGALGAIATDANFSVDPGLDSLGGALGQMTDEKKAGSVAGLVKLLGGWATAGVRRASLDDAIGQVDGVSAIIDGISHVVVADYEGLLLRGEGGQLEVMMGNAAADLSLPPPPPCTTPYPPWGVPQEATARSSQFMFQAFYNDRCEALLARRLAVLSFRSSAASLQQALGDLRDNRARLRTGAAVEAVLADAKRLFSDAQAVRQAFAGAAAKP